MLDYATKSCNRVDVSRVYDYCLTEAALIYFTMLVYAL